jgi:hypothetical protein
MAFTPITVTPQKVVAPYQGAEPGNTLSMSGTSGAASFCGPWMIETQWLNINYARTGKFWFDSDASATLSGANYTLQCLGSELIFNVAASYSKKKSYECFDTSAYVQSQTFNVVAASADARGMTYGTDAQFTASTLGPAGNILTLTPWVWRRKWDADIDEEVDQLCDGWNANAVSSNCTNQVTAFSIEDQWQSLSRSPALGKPGTKFSDPQGDGRIWVGWPNYGITGKYSYTRETNDSLISFITGVGSSVRYTNFYSNPVTIGGNNCASKTEGCAAYDEGKHAYI